MTKNEKNAAWPVRREKQCRGGDTQPGKHANRKQTRVHKMEDYGCAECRDPSAAPKQKRHNQEIKQKGTITHRVNSPFFAKEPAKDWEIGPASQPCPHRFAT